MKMDIIPEGVVSCLYTGIFDRIEYVRKTIQTNDYSQAENIEKVYVEICNAVDWYNTNCVVSGKYLIERLDNLKNLYYPYMTNYIVSK